MMRSFYTTTGAIPLTLLLLAAALPSAAAQAPYSIGDRDEILASARTLAFDLISFYKGNETGEIPGLLPGPPTEGKGDYYWWQGSVFWGTFIDYWRLTGDDTYNDVVTQGLLHQVGQDDDFMPANQTATLYNDDQCHWAVTAMLAAESRFPSPAGAPDWLTIAQNVFEHLAWRLDQEDDSACGGGLRWPVFSSSPGYEYKNSQTNGCFLNLAARLALYTGNETYAGYVEKSWDWQYGVGIIDNDIWRVYDGGREGDNCTRINKAIFSNAASHTIQGSAFMYNHTGSDVWRNRTAGLAQQFLSDFVEDNGALSEVACEKNHNCHADMLSFKGMAHRWLASSTQVAPFLGDTVLPALRVSAQTAVDQCTGGDSGRQCGFYWSTGSFVDPEEDQTSGASEQMNVLGAVSALLISEADAPARQSTSAGSGGGNGDGNGSGSDGGPGEPGGASLQSASLLTLTVGMSVWAVMNML